MTILKFKLIILLTSISLIYGFSSIKNKQPESEVELGKMLFFEKKLSKDNSISCASCHKPEYAFADTVAFSKGINGRVGFRNAPSIMNMKDRQIYFYDGRANSLEDQVHFPIEDTLEMSLSFEIAVKKIENDIKYKKYFLKIYGEKPTSTNIPKAIAAFERTLETSNTPFDDYMQDKENTMAESAIRGRRIFMSEKAKCFDCHFGPDLTGDEFRNIGLYNGIELIDEGRFTITKDSSDLGKFKVPGLRNVAITAPYMHNGMFKTLDEVINYYDNPNLVISNAINTDDLLAMPLNLSNQEKTDLKHFLESLTDKQFISNKTSR